MRRYVVLLLLMLVSSCVTPRQGTDAPSSPSSQAPIHIDSIRSKAEKGDLYAQSVLGGFYESGTMVPKDLKEAEKWFRLAAENGNDEDKQRLRSFLQDYKNESNDVVVKNAQVKNDNSEMSESSCYIENADLRGEYIGKCVDGKAHGQGIAKGKNTYSGNFYKGKMHGKGEIKFSNGSTYYGDVVFGNITGKGKMTTVDGRIYVGDFVRGKYDGYGEESFPNGIKYFGQYHNGLFYGTGQLTYPNGKKFVGDFVDGNGVGEIIGVDGAKSSVSYNDGKLIPTTNAKQSTNNASNRQSNNGYGELKYSDDSVYKGDIVNGVPHGKGEYTVSNGAKYTGDFINGTLHGIGRLTFTGGGSYYGQFDNGKRTGKGELIQSNGTVYRGDFVDGVPHGKGQFISQNGQLKNVTAENGNIEGETNWGEIFGAVVSGLAKGYTQGQAIRANQPMYTPPPEPTNMRCTKDPGLQSMTCRPMSY
ncbi:MAG: hypothetical protein H7836_11735 [Magnetococcus sp. YQC-3]